MINLTKKKYSKSGELSKLTDSQLVTIFKDYYQRLEEGRIFKDYQPTVVSNLETIQTILVSREERRKSSSPEKEIENIRLKIKKEQEVLESLEKKLRKIESQKEDLQFKIKHQEERLVVLLSILER